MASRNHSESFKKAMIDFEEMTITEYLKDEINVYDLRTVIKRWSGVDGITLTIKTDEDIEPDREG